MAKRTFEVFVKKFGHKVPFEALVVVGGGRKHHLTTDIKAFRVLESAGVEFECIDSLDVTITAACNKRMGTGVVGTFSESPDEAFCVACMRRTINEGK
jgi:aspartokinase